MKTILCLAVVSVVVSGCSSSRTTMLDQDERIEKEIIVTSLLTREGCKVDFSTSFPGYAILADSVVRWTPTRGEPKEWQIAQLTSYTVSEFSWWKTVVFVLAIPITWGVVMLLTTRWTFS